MGKVKLGDKKKEEYIIPDIRNIVRCFRSETLFIFGINAENTKYRWCLGVGRVSKIKQGENFDLLYLNFGRKYAREIIVQYNHARRQLLTLKKGQLATFYGKFKLYVNEDGEMRTVFYAIGLQAWYVPKNMDIVKIDPNDIEKLTKENESKINFIDELLKGED